MHTASPVPLSGTQGEEELLEMALFSTTIAGLEVARRENPSSLPPNTSTHIPFWLKFLVLAAYQVQLSKELLVPVGALGTPVTVAQFDNNLL